MFGMFVIGFPDVVEPLVLALVVAAIMCLTLCQMVLTSACCHDVASKQDMSLLVIVALSLCFSDFSSLPSHPPLSLHTHPSPFTLSLSTSLPHFFLLPFPTLSPLSLLPYSPPTPPPPSPSSSFPLPPLPPLTSPPFCPLPSRQQ